MTPWARFGIEIVEQQPEFVVATMPMDNLLNPLTNQLAAGPLAVLVDFAVGVVNYSRCDSGEWMVSSELSLDLSPDAMGSLATGFEVPVVMHARQVGSKDNTALGVCEITHRDVFIGTGTLRNVYFTPRGAGPGELDLHSRGTRPFGLNEIMAVVAESGSDGCATLRQCPNPALNNPLGIMHGGVAAAGLELAASAAVNAGLDGDPMLTASLRVNYLHEFVSGDTSRYEARCLRVGRRSAMAEAHAIGADDAVALVGRVTAYRI